MDEPKRRYYKWKQEDLAKAIKALKLKQLGLNECSRRYGIPKPTLKRHILKQNKYSNDADVYKGRPTVFPDHIEKQLTHHLLQLESCMFGLTISDVRRLAFQIAEQNSIKHNFNKEKKMAGKSWFYKFMRRHPELSLRRPESTSINRIKGFNKENVTDFYNKLEQIVDEKGITANTLFNVDETGVSTVQKKPQKILGQKGKKQVGSVSSGERGVNTTAVCATSASGQYIPPMIIFKRKRMSPLLQNGALPGSIVTISDTGYINSELFVRWMQHFIDTVKPSQDKNVLLLLDGHTTHSKNLEAIKLARNNGVIMLQLPGHTTHRLQPMDVSIFGPLSTYYIQEMETWMRANSGQAVTQYEVTQLFSKAYQRAATIGNAISGFEATGVWPVNRHIFQDHHFVIAEIFQNQNDMNEVNTISDEDHVPSDVINVSEPGKSHNFNRNSDVDTDSTTSDVTCCSSRCESASILTQNINVENESHPESLLTITISHFNNMLPTFRSCKSDQLTDEVKPSSEIPTHLPKIKFRRKVIDSSSDTKVETANKDSHGPSTSTSGVKNTSCLKVSIQMLFPIPKNKQSNKRKKAAQKTITLTSSPYKIELEEAIQKRAAKLPKPKFDASKRSSNTKKSNIKEKKIATTKTNLTKSRKMCTTEGSTEDKKIDEQNLASTSSTTRTQKNTIGQPKNNIKKTGKRIASQNKGKGKGKVTKKRKRQSSESSVDEELVVLDDSSDIEEDECKDYCAICNGYYYDKQGPKVDWIQCIRCRKWIHDTCSDNPDICPKCLK